MPMKVVYIIVVVLLLSTVAFTQQEGQVSFDSSNLPELKLEGIKDTLTWSGNVIITFDDYNTLNVVDLELTGYLIRIKNNKNIICGSLFLDRINVCSKKFDDLFIEIESIISNIKFYFSEGPEYFPGKKLMFLFHFTIKPQLAVD